MIEFDNAVSDLGYYLDEPSQTPPTFQGKGSRILGIEGEFSPQTLDRLYRGMQPDRDEKLVTRIRADRRGAFEMTLSLPKSPSIMKELAGDERIKGVMDDAQAVVMKQVESQVRTRVRKASEVEKSKKPKTWRYPERRTENLTYVTFSHPTSRSGDPHYHRHIVILNLTYDKQEKQWKAVELRHIDRPAIAKAYTEALVKGLHRLGYKTTRSGKEFEIVGVPAEVKAEFSRRNAQIKQIAEQYPEAKPKARSKHSVYDRPEKLDIPLEERKKTWKERITKGQLSQLTDLMRRAKNSVRMARMRRNLKRHIDATQQIHQEQSHGLER